MVMRKFYSCLAIDAMFEGGRLFVGATSAAYLLSQGVSISQIALLKSVQAAIILLGEIPTGLVADVYGKKKSLLLSQFVALFGFILYYSGNSFPIYLIAEALVALSLCFWSGAYESFAIEQARLESEPGQMDRFFHLNQSINSGAVLVCGYLGGLVGNGGLGLPYLGAALIFMFALVTLIPMNSSHKTEVRNQHTSTLKSMAEKAKIAFKQGFLSKKLAPFFWANIAIQFAIQPMIHFWQPLFQSMGSDVTSETLGRIFSMYCAVNLVFGALASRFSKSPLFRSQLVTVTLFGLFGVFYFLTGQSSNLALAVSSFCLAQGLLSVARTSLSVRFNVELKGLPRATILSYLSLISRLGMISALGILSLTTKATSEASQQSYFMGFGLFSIVASMLVGILILSRSALFTPVTTNLTKD